MTIDENMISEFLMRSIGQLQVIMPAANHQWSVTRVERIENGHTIHGSSRPDFSAIIAMGYMRGQLPSIGEFAKAIEVDDRYRKIVSGTVAQWYVLIPNQIAQSILRNYVGRLDRLSHDESLANRVAENFLHSLDSGHSKVVFYSVAQGLECDFEGCLLPGDVKLRKLADEEAVQLVEFHNQSLLHEDMLFENCCLLEQQFELPVNPPPPEIDVTNQQPSDVAAANFDAVITGLRLLKEGHVQRQSVYTRYEEPGQLVVPNIGGVRIYRIKRFPIFKTYCLSETDVPNLSKILEAIKNRLTSVRLRIAVDRVNFAAERERSDDILLDLLIALEALYGDSAGAIGYKIGLRCATFIETDYEKREQIHRLVGDAYSRRSALVHGGKKNDSDLNLTTDEIVVRLQAVVRQSISCVVAKSLSGQGVPIGSDFDKLLLQSAQS